MFEHFRQSLRDLMDRSTPPEERRAGLAQMKQTLVQARMGLDDLRKGVEQTRQRVAAEARELETVRRRKGLAAGINDQETVSLAEKYEAMHTERAEILTRKLAAQESELALVEREVAEMTSALKGALSGATTGTPLQGSEAAEVDEMLDGGARVAEEIDAMGRASSRSAREAEADRLLAELKRRMGK
jgi:ribosome assembly protein YihI (activator of Der GTPase)